MNKCIQVDFYGGCKVVQTSNSEKHRVESVVTKTAFNQRVRSHPRHLHRSSPATHFYH
jgi:hypothetical protein